MARIRLAELKVKIKSLAWEMAEIHRDETRAARGRNRARARRRALDGEHLSHRAIRAAAGPPPDFTIVDADVVTPIWDFARWNWRAEVSGTREQHVASEAHHHDVHESLRGHRQVLKAEMRASLAAYAYLRGRPWFGVEAAGSRSEPDWDRVQAIAERFSGRVAGARLNAWRSGQATIEDLDREIGRLSAAIASH